MYNVEEMKKNVYEAVNRTVKSPYKMGVDVAELKYLAPVVNVLRMYDTDRVRVNEYHNNRIGNIIKVYGDSQRGKEYKQTAKDEYKVYMDMLRAEVKAECQKEFDKIEEKLQKHVIAPIPAELQEHVDYLSKHASNMTNEEKTLIVNACKGNYKAIRVVNNYINPKLDLQSYDDIEGDLKQMKKIVYDAISGVSTEYMYRLSLYGSLQKSLDDGLKEFMGE